MTEKVNQPNGLLIAEFAERFGVSGNLVWRYCTRHPELVTRVPGGKAGWRYLIYDVAGMVAAMTAPRVRLASPDSPPTPRRIGVEGVSLDGAV